MVVNFQPVGKPKVLVSIRLREEEHLSALYWPVICNCLDELQLRPGQNSMEKRDKKSIVADEFLRKQLEKETP